MRVTATTLAASVSLALLALAAGCSQQADGHAGMGGMPPPEVIVTQVAPKNLPVVFEYVGQTAGSKEVEIRGRVTGILEKRLYEEGSAVKAGQPLFLIDPKPFEAQLAAADADVASAQAKLEQTRREAARLKPLIEQRATSQKEFDDAVSNEQFANASLKSAQARLIEARLNLGYTRVNAPVSGITSKAMKSEGSLVQAGGDSLLTTLVQVDPLYVNFTVSEDDQLKLEREAAEGKLTMPKGGYKLQVKLSDGSIYGHAGKLNFTDAKVSNTTGTVEARGELPNPDGKLKAGQFVRVLVSGAERPNAIAVPQRAVLESGQGKFVFVVGKGKEGPVAEIRPVEVGEWVNLSGAEAKGWVVNSGLKAGDQVIVDGIPKLRPGAPIKVTTAGAAPAGAPPAGAKPKA